MTTASLYTGLIDKYRDRLPLPADAPAVSLCEGQTPLIRLANIERDLGGDLAIYAKFEGLNPTGSFKDRGPVRSIAADRPSNPYGNVFWGLT